MASSKYGVELEAEDGEDVNVNPPGLETPGIYVSSHWPGRNWYCYYIHV